MARVYLVPASLPGPDDEPFFTLLARALELLEERGLPLELMERSEEEAFTRVLWQHHVTGACLRLWHDRTADVRHLEVSAPKARVADKLVAALKRTLEIAPLEVLLADARARGSEEPRLLVRAAYGAGEACDEELVELIRSATASASPKLRAMAAYAAGILGWPELGPTLAEALAAERDASVRLYLERAIEMMEG